MHTHKEAATAADQLLAHTHTNTHRALLVLFHFRYSQDYQGYSGEVPRISEHITQRPFLSLSFFGLSTQVGGMGDKELKISHIWGWNHELSMGLHCWGCRHLSSQSRQQQTWWAGHSRTYSSLLQSTVEREALMKEHVSFNESPRWNL